MTRDEYNALPSDGREACPDCGLRQTNPYPGCGCPTEITPQGFNVTQHINAWHHDCSFARLTQGILR
jgi:hypothetical protein